MSTNFSNIKKIDAKILKRFATVLNDSKAIQPATKNELRKNIKRFIVETYSPEEIRKFKKFKFLKAEKDVNHRKR